MVSLQHTKKNDWDELETLLKQVDKVGERLTANEEDDDSTILLNKNENEESTTGRLSWRVG